MQAASEWPRIGPAVRYRARWVGSESLELQAIHAEDSIGDNPVFELSAQQIHHRLVVAARAAGLGGEFSGHSA